MVRFPQILQDKKQSPVFRICALKAAVLNMVMDEAKGDVTMAGDGVFTDKMKVHIHKNNTLDYRVG